MATSSDAAATASDGRPATRPGAGRPAALVAFPHPAGGRARVRAADRLGGTLMIVGGPVEIVLGVDAEGTSLESVAKPSSVIRDATASLATKSASAAASLRR